MALNISKSRNFRYDQTVDCSVSAFDQAHHSTSTVLSVLFPIYLAEVVFTSACELFTAAISNGSNFKWQLRQQVVRVVQTVDGDFIILDFPMRT